MNYPAASCGVSKRVQPGDKDRQTSRVPESLAASRGESDPKRLKKIRFTQHALEQCAERGVHETEVSKAIVIGHREPAKQGRILCRANFQYNDTWQGRFYRIKQIAPVIKEEYEEIVVITDIPFISKS